jgi:hypothetical protein
MSTVEPIISVEPANLAPGSLAELFSKGALAVMVECPSTLRTLWSGLLENQDEQLPWCGTMGDMARNHYAGDGLGEHVGDMFHYTPYRIAYTARKFELVQDPATSQIVSVPEHFIQGTKRFKTPSPVLEICWKMIHDIMDWLGPPTRPPARFQAVVHRLKYESDLQLTDQHYALTKSAIGRWAQLGFDIDKMREEARGPLDHKGISDICAVLSLSPPLGKVVERMNRAFARNDARRALPQGARLIGKPHHDGRFFSATCGERSHISTEVYDGRHWIELPVDCHHLVVIPGLQAQTAFGLKPTLHRVLHRGESASAADEGSDITLLLGSKETGGRHRAGGFFPAF